MNGVHDMGGMDGFGKVEPEQNEPVFHTPWEGRVYAMQRAMTFAGAWNIDMSRYAQEKLRPEIYLSSSYYKRWELGIETNVISRGFADADELATGRGQRPGKPLQRKLTVEDVKNGLSRGSWSRPASTAALFKAGDRVRTRNNHPPTHTRLPRYARGRAGIVEIVHGCHVFPDTVAIDQGENPQWLYTVVFTSHELWGDDADTTVKISIDAFEPYLESA